MSCFQPSKRQAYSQSVNPGPWLASREVAEAMADQVSRWPEQYPGCDGIDLDIENGAGDDPQAGENLVHFLSRLNKLAPDMIVVVPTYGYPQIPAEIDMINAGWDEDGDSTGIIDSIGIMVYDGPTSLDWVEQYTDSDGSIITADVPETAVLVGCKVGLGIFFSRFVTASMLFHSVCDYYRAPSPPVCTTSLLTA